MSEVWSIAAKGDLFRRRIREHRTEQLGRRLDILSAGSGGDARLDLERMESRVTGIDEDHPALRVRVEGDESLFACALGDLRSVPVPPRSFDVVHAAFLFERIRHTELVLDRLLNGLRPGGLMLVRMRDRDSAYGFCARVMPWWLRRLLWPRFAPAGAVGPLPAVYEPITTREGMRSFCLVRGLMITDEVVGTGGPALRGPLSRTARVVCSLVHRLSRGRLALDHDEIVMVIRKPQNHFARLI
ncbi:Methyltransferase domain-containing protein [Sinosporangium album]|uniref:Methyltransferase domain-containing protein n=1 Tax=Sinosporangium album TaxID=504805 RepID=A0A1G8AJ73_9ACTN|nr:class I SAM-dependent methyltransferase [Sinosporangium album]SDH21024.1 Methyltransferase domain-containing protein [Sinosporangium album]